jgi:hypothetical protein
MRTNVVLRSRSDAMLMAYLLSAELRSLDLDFLSGDPASSNESSARTPLPIGEGLEVNVQWLGRPLSSVYSTARTLLAVRGEPVALVLDAGSTEPDMVSRQRQGVEEVIGEAAMRAPFGLFLAIPALQSLLFTRPALLVRSFGEGADQGGRVLDIGRLSPREAYKRLDPDAPEGITFGKLIDQLGVEDIAALREESPVRELIAFLAEVGSSVASASPVP